MVFFYVLLYITILNRNCLQINEIFGKKGGLIFLIWHKAHFEIRENPLGERLFFG